MTKGVWGGEVSNRLESEDEDRAAFPWLGNPTALICGELALPRTVNFGRGCVNSAPISLGSHFVTFCLGSSLALKRHVTPDDKAHPILTAYGKSR